MTLEQGGSGDGRRAAGGGRRGITHRQVLGFLRLECRLLTLTPAWRDRAIAERESAVRPPPVAPMPRRRVKDPRLLRGRPAVRPEQVLEAAAKLARPGEELTARQIADSSGIPVQSVAAVAKNLRKSGRWPYRCRGTPRYQPPQEAAICHVASSS